MGVKEFKIIFDNPMKTYHAGKTVTGRIVLNLDSPKKCRGIKIKIRGAAKTSWKRGKHWHRGDEEYFSKKYYHLGGENDELEMGPGEHIFLFDYELPPNLPSSYENILGSVRYTIKGIIDRPWKFDNETKAAFTVVSLYDLNTDPRASEPVSVEKSKTFGCWSPSPPLSVNISLPVRGYVPGQLIPVKINVENDSDIDIPDVILKLNKLLTFHVTKPNSATEKKNKTIVQISKGPVSRRDVVIFEHLLKVPPLPPSNSNNCSIIDIRYELEVEAYDSDPCSRNLKASTLILIGTVPLVTYQLLLVPPVDSKIGKFPPSVPASLTPSAMGPSPSAPPDYSTAVNSSTFSLPPPSYEESIFGAKSLQDEDDSAHTMGIREYFAPRYPVYNFSST